MSSITQRQRLGNFGFPQGYAKTLTNSQASKLISSLYQVVRFYYGGDFVRLSIDVKDFIARRVEERGCSNV